MFIVRLFVSYAHVHLCHFFSSYWYRGLAAASACGSLWTFLFTFFRSRNSQTCTTRFRFSELGSLVLNFSNLSIWGFSTADKSFVLGQLLKVVHVGKIMCILIGTSPGLGIIAGWGLLPISMVLRSEKSLKSAEMLSLEGTSKYLKILKC